MMFEAFTSDYTISYGEVMDAINTLAEQEAILLHNAMEALKTCIEKLTTDTESFAQALEEAAVKQEEEHQETDDDQNPAPEPDPQDPRLQNKRDPQKHPP